MKDTLWITFIGIFIFGSCSSKYLIIVHRWPIRRHLIISRQFLISSLIINLQLGYFFAFMLGRALHYVLPHCVIKNYVFLADYDGEDTKNEFLFTIKFKPLLCRAYRQKKKILIEVLWYRNCLLGEMNI